MFGIYYFLFIGHIWLSFAGLLLKFTGLGKKKGYDWAFSPLSPRRLYYREDPLHPFLLTMALLLYKFILLSDAHIHNF